jgi:hypothetical protein
MASGARGQDHVAVFLAVVVTQLAGILWYSPAVFFDPWARGFGLDPSTFQQTDPTVFAVAIGAAFLAAYTVSWLLRRLDLEGAFAGARLGFLLWLGLVLPAVWTHYAFAGLSRHLVAIDAGSTLLSLLLTGTILGAWRSRALRSDRSG